MGNRYDIHEHKVEWLIHLLAFLMQRFLNLITDISPNANPSTLRPCPQGGGSIRLDLRPQISSNGKIIVGSPRLLEHFDFAAEHPSHRLDSTGMCLLLASLT